MDKEKKFNFLAEESQQGFWVDSQELTQNTQRQTAKTETARKEEIANKLRAENERLLKEGQPEEKREMVIHGATLHCPYAQSEGKLKVTSNEILLQDRICATEGDGNNMINLKFSGVCNHPKWGDKKPACQSVINLSPWQNLGKTVIQEQRVLVKESYISCNPSPNTAVASPIPQVKSIMENKINTKSTYFLFLDSKTNAPIYNLKIYIKFSENKILNFTTNNSGYIEINSNIKGTYTLLNSKHPEITKEISNLYYKNFFNVVKYEKADISYLKKFTKKNTYKTKKGLLPFASVKIQSGDSLEIFTMKSQLGSNNRGDLLFRFNWGNPIKDTYYNFDFGTEGIIFKPLLNFFIGKLEERVTHIFYLTDEIKRSSLSQKILNSANIVRRNIWSKINMNNYNIINPKLINPKRSKLEFDCNYHTIVIHNSGNKLSTKVNEVEKLHIVENNWEDIGYHYIIGRKENGESNIYEGRPLIFKGSHAGGLNSGKLGVLVEGDFEHQWWDFDDDVEPEQLKLLEKLIGVLIKNIPTIKNLVGHSDVIGKSAEDTCPGEELYKYLPKLRSKFKLSNKIINS